MYVWEKTKDTTFPASVWGKSGWGKLDPIKVLVRSPLFKIPSPSLLKFTLVLIKISIRQNEITQFDTLHSEILYTIDMWNFSLVHHKTFETVLA